MHVKLGILPLVLCLPATSWAQGNRAFAESQSLFERAIGFMPQTTGMHVVELFKDNGVLHGMFQFSGQSTTTTTDLVGSARTVAESIRAAFSIPPEYAWTLAEGCLSERKAVQTVQGGWRAVAFMLTVDGVALDPAELSVTFDTDGRMRTIRGSIPRLRPEIVSAVRGPVEPPFNCAVAVQSDAIALPRTTPSASFRESRWSSSTSGRSP